MTRREDIDAKRKDTPCFFQDGISNDKFTCLAHRVAEEFGRIKDVSVIGPVIYCTVESQTGSSEWTFSVDFNNWGHITGTYWQESENTDSHIPEKYGNLVSACIHRLLDIEGIKLTDFSDYVDADSELGTSHGLFHYEKVSPLKKLFTRKKYAMPPLNSSGLTGEHVYPVFAALKQSGFKQIGCLPVADVGPESSNYVFEVKEVSINGESTFRTSDCFEENARVSIRYHTKKKILSPSKMRSYRKKNYVKVGDILQDRGFTNIYERKIRDLKTGWLIKDGSVEEILVCIDGEEQPMLESRLYEFDTEIIITYHTF